MNTSAPWAPALRLLVAGLSLIVLVAGERTLAAEEIPAPVVGGEKDTRIQFPNMPLRFILIEYEKLTGTKVIMDQQAAAATLSIETSGLMTRSEAAAFVEKSLLFNGYALVPAGDGLAKLVAYQAGGQPGSEGVPVVADPADLPPGDAVVSFIMPLANITPEEATRTFSQVAPGHSYGTIIPLPNAQAVIITENTSTIRTLLDLKEHIDVAPSQTTQRNFPLQRASAEEVAEALEELLGLGNQDGGGAPFSPAPAAAPGDPNAALPTGLGSPGSGQGRSGLSATPSAPKIHAIDRTNSVLVVARPVDMEYIASLVTQLDSPSDLPTLVRKELSYIPALQFLPVARDAILRGNAGGGDAGGAAGDLSAGTGFDRPAAPGATGEAGRFQQVSLEAPQDQGGPRSVVVGKTLIIADPTRNEIFASGPPEHIRVLSELLELMDRRPRQVFINMVIGQFNIGDDVEIGIDVLGALDDFSVGSREGYGAGAFLSNPERPIPDPATLLSVDDFAGAGAGLSLYGHIGRSITAAVTALESTNRFKMLSRPSIYALNNEKAVISTGQKIAVPTSTLSTLDPGGGFNSGFNQAVTSNIGFEEVLLRIEVVPLINSDDEVTLRISQVNDDIVGSTEVSGNRIPTIGTEQLTTTVIVPNGRTVMLGGLVTEDTEDTVSGLPLFVRVPFLKHLFGKTNRGTTRQELVILIQPHILDDGPQPGYLSEVPAGRGRAAHQAVEFLNGKPVKARPFVPTAQPIGPIPRASVVR